jgi:hypothetical protein
MDLVCSISLTIMLFLILYLHVASKGMGARTWNTEGALHMALYILVECDAHSVIYSFSKNVDKEAKVNLILNL